MGELLAQVGDLVFSIFVGYLGALEFLYVVRHLYHWTFRHGEGGANNDAKSLRRLQDGVRNQLDAAAAREATTGTQVMQDGVPYKDGFRINPNQQELDELKAKLSCSSDDKEARRKEIEAELARQKRIEEETKQQLQKAEDDLQRQRQLIAAAEGEEQAKQLLEAERNREEQQRRVEIEKQEKEENERKLLEAEKEEEEQQKRREEEERAEEERSVAAEQKRLEEARNARLAQLELERQREEQQREMELRKKEGEKAISEEAERQRALEDARLQAEREAERLLKAERDFELLQEQIEEQVAAEQVRLLLEAEREQERRQRDNEENTERLLEIERRKEEEQRRNDITRAANENEEIKDKHEEEEEIAELDNAKKFIDFMSGQQNLEEEQDSAEIILSSERDNELKHKETEDGEGSRSTTADREKERLRKIKEENARKFLEAEEEMVELQRQMEAGVQKRQVSLTQQESVVEEPCIRKEFRPLYEPDRVPQSIKTQFKQARNEVSLSSKTLRFPSLPDDTSSLEPGSLSTQSSLSAQISEDMSANEPVVVGVLEREAPDGEDNVPAIHYTDEYLRSLDGIKQRPLTREDGSGRRRAFKKRRSSGSSNSSRDSRASREEEVKMFTSLEEEEMAEGKKGGGDDDFTTIKYSSEPTLKVKGHRRRHKRSPAQDAKASDDSLRNSLEMLNEESTNPWGEVVPEHYKNTDFWKREKGISIDEEEVEAAKPETKAQAVAMEAATNIPNASSFEDATQTQHEDALLSLQKQTSKGTEKEVNRDAPPNDRNANTYS